MHAQDWQAGPSAGYLTTNSGNLPVVFIPRFTPRSRKAPIVDHKIEVVTLPVADADRSVAFYRDAVGFALDVDWSPHDRYRVVQLTPTGSATSIQFGVGLTDATPGSTQGTYLVVADAEAFRDQLATNGVRVLGLRHKAPDTDWQGGYEPGVHPERRDYSTFFDFVDPDGNSWTVQERGFVVSLPR